MPYKKGAKVMKRKKSKGTLNVDNFNPKYDGPWTIIKINKNKMTYEIEDTKEQVIRAHHIQLREWKESPHYLKSAIGRQTERSLCNDKQKTYNRVESKGRSNSSRVELCWQVGDSTTTTSGISDSEFEDNCAYLTETCLSDERLITEGMSEAKDSSTITEYEDLEEDSEYGVTTINIMTEDLDEWVEKF